MDKGIQGNNGINCGWNNKDHGNFIKMVVKHGEQWYTEEFMNDCLVVLTHIDQEEVRVHLEKYKVYKDYERDKKFLLNAYKDLKQHLQKAKVALLNREEVNVQSVQQRHQSQA